jgi:hypothetical protein
MEYYNLGEFLFYYVDDELILSVDSNTLETLITTNEPIGNLPDDTGIVAKYSRLYLDYYNGIINNGDYIFKDNFSGSTGIRIYLKMYIDSDKNLTIKFASSPEGDPDTKLENFSINYEDGLIIYSNKSSYKQTLEIENTSYIDDYNNVNYIYVDKDRYSEIGKGWYLEAYYDKEYYDSPGVGYQMGAVPRKLVKVVKTAIPINSDLKIVYTDGPIRIIHNTGSGSTDYYTTAYMSIDNYVTEYN